jgi:hypothetical protein
MKKTRLLEIVREEISIALNEAGLVDQITALEKQKDALEKQKSPLIKKEADLTKKIADLQKKEADAQVKSNATLEEEQLNEIEQLAEMASIVQLKTQLEKQGKTGELAAVKAAEKVTIDKLKQNPVFSGEGKNARLKGYVSALKKELKAEHDINLQDLLTKVMLDAEKAGDKFKDDIATNTIEKDAAAQVLGTEKGQRGRKASEPKVTEPKATETDKATAAASKTPKLDKLANNQDSLLKAQKETQTKMKELASKIKGAEGTERENLMGELKKLNKLNGEIQSKLDKLF